MNQIDEPIIPDRCLTYTTYLKIDELLSLQKTLNKPAAHDEMLFIIIHQVYELWFKQILHEVEHAARSLQASQNLPFLRSMERVVTIQRLLNQQVDILETMTPSDFNEFRDNLNPASGFQSLQFRIVEFKLGQKDPLYLKFFRHDTRATQALTDAMNGPSLYDIFLRSLKKQGFAIPAAVVERDVSQAHVLNEDLVQTFVEIYRKPDKNYELYMILETLLDVDEWFRLWRYRHVSMVERMIGGRKGTGGSSGARYLNQTLEKRFFPEIWQVRDHLGKGYGNAGQ